MNSFSTIQKEMIWKNYFGLKVEGFDAFGRYVNKFTFQCDHIFPKSKGGKTIVKNGIPLSPKSNQEKSNNLRGYINKNFYEIIWNDNGYGELYINGYLYKPKN